MLVRCCQLHWHGTVLIIGTLLKVLSSLQYLARQGCAIRGHDDKCDCNLYQLMKFVSKDDSKVVHLHLATQ